MASKIFQFTEQDYENAVAYWKSEKEVTGTEAPAHHRLWGVIGEMAAHWYLESLYPMSGILPYGLMTRAGVCNLNGFNSGDIVVLRGNSAMRFEVKATSRPERCWLIKENDAAQYHRDGIDQILFVSVNNAGRLPEAEIYGRVSPGEILCFWEYAFSEDGQRMLVNPEPPTASINMQRWIASHQKQD